MRHKRKAKVPKVLVIGLDGASFNLIGDWTEQGMLPNIERFKKESCWGPLRSSIPPVTFPAWRCYSTGKNPGKLGVYWWQHIDLQNRDVFVPNATSFKSEDLWHHLNKQGIKAGIMGMPGTFPPSKVDGFMISGGPDSASKRYTYPSELEVYLSKNGYKVHPTISGDLREGSPLVGEILGIIEQKFTIVKLLLNRMPVDFLHVSTFYLNWLQHFFWQGGPVKQAWRMIDSQLNSITNQFDFVIVMSDHGTAPMQKVFFINAWLEKEGYLHRKRATKTDLLLKIGVNKTRILKILEPLHLSGFLSKFDSLRRLARFVPNEGGITSDLSGKSYIDGIDWDRTRVIGLPQGPLYVNRALLRSKTEYEQLREELISKLEHLRDPETGGKPIQKVYRREEVYQGDYLNEAPDLIAVDSNEYHNRGGVMRGVLFQKGKWQGNNALHGLFMIRGPGIKENAYVEDIDIYDLAPIIFRLMRCPIPRDLDGRVPEEIFIG